MLLAALIATIVGILLIIAFSLGYRFGQLDGFSQGYEEGSPKLGETVALRTQLSSMQKAFEENESEMLSLRSQLARRTHGPTEARA
jgi:hypothetical protein